MSFQLDTILDRGAFAKLPRMFLFNDTDAPHQRRGKALLIALLLIAGAGGVAALVALALGHHVMGTYSEVPWGILIGTYVFLVVSSTGLGLVSSLGHVFGYKVFEPIAKKAMFLALVTLVIGFSVIATELERPFLLAKLVVLSPNPRAPIWWMGTLYGVYLFIIAAELYFLLAGDHHKARIGGVITVAAALSVHPTSNLGGVFGLSHARPYWYGPLMPIYFIASALVCGAAILILMVYFGDYFRNQRKLREENAPLVDALRRLLALFIGITGFLTIWKNIVGITGADLHVHQVTMALLSGPLFVSFWLFEVFLGMVVPLTILLGQKGKSASSVALAAGLTMLGVFVTRWNFIYAGQMYSLRPLAGRSGERLVYQPPFKGNLEGFLAYTPSLVEILIVAGAISAVILLYVGGSRLLRLEAEPAKEA